jgi:hypothetical protein
MRTASLDTWIQKLKDGSLSGDDLKNMLIRLGQVSDGTDKQMNNSAQAI